MRSRPTIRSRRLLRGSIALLVLVGQLVGSLGWAATVSVSVRASGRCGTRPCGCIVESQSAPCCCDQIGLPQPLPPPKKRACCKSQPESPNVHSCCDKPVVKPTTSPKRWFAEIASQRCRGETPPSTTNYEPECSPNPPDVSSYRHERVGLLIPASDRVEPTLTSPPIPPPRLA